MTTTTTRRRTTWKWATIDSDRFTSSPGGRSRHKAASRKRLSDRLPPFIHSTLRRNGKPEWFSNTVRRNFTSQFSVSFEFVQHRVDFALWHATNVGVCSLNRLFDIEVSRARMLSQMIAAELCDVGSIFNVKRSHCRPSRHARTRAHYEV